MGLSKFKERIMDIVSDKISGRTKTRKLEYGDFVRLKNLSQKELKEIAVKSGLMSFIRFYRIFDGRHVMVNEISMEDKKTSHITVTHPDIPSTLMIPIDCVEFLMESMEVEEMDKMNVLIRMGHTV